MKAPDLTFTSRCLKPMSKANQKSLRPRLTALLVMLLCFGSSHAEESIRIGFAYFPPYSEVKDGECKGDFCDIARKIFTDTLGINILPVQHPWARIQREVELGNIDVMFAIPSEQRRSYAMVSDAPIYMTRMKVFTYTGHKRLAEIEQIESVSDIETLHLIPIANQGNGWIAEHLEPLDINIVRAINDIDIIRMLAAQRGDIVIDVARSMRHMAEDMALENKIIETDVVLDEANIHLMMNKHSRFTHLMPEINQLINSIPRR